MLSANDPTHSASEPHAHHPASVCLSLSEINALCFKAARGAGLAWGEAEEAGWAAAWLSRAGLAGPRIILAWLSEAAALARPAPAPGHWAVQAAPHCPLRTGIALADFAGLPEGPGAHPLTIAAVAHPVLTLPFVARAAERAGRALRIAWAGADIVLDATGLLSEAQTPGTPDREPADLSIAAAAGPVGSCTKPHHAVPRAAVAFDHWLALDALALRITVPPSAQSRAGAGAAGNDND